METKKRVEHTRPRLPESSTAQEATKKDPPKFIVLDSNVFIADYWLRSPSFVLLRDFLAKTGAILVTPKIVLEEVINHQKEELERAKSQVRSALRDVGRLVRNFKGQSEPILAITKALRQDPFEKFLSFELAGLKSIVPDYSKIPHSEVVGRDLQRRKPFQESGKGYRDTLLWETILGNCIGKGTNTVFITANVRDFCDSTGNIHPDLKKDLLAREADANSLVFCRDLPIFTDTYIIPFLKKRKDFAILVQNGKVPGLTLRDVCEENIDSLIDALNSSPSVMIGDPGTHEPEVDTVEIRGEFRVQEASEISNDVLLVVFEFDAEVYFTYFLSRSDYYTMSDEESSRVAILDAEWNEHVMQVETGTTVRFKCRLTFDSKEENVESFEVEAVENVEESS